MTTSFRVEPNSGTPPAPPSRPPPLELPLVEPPPEEPLLVPLPELPPLELLPPELVPLELLPPVPELLEVPPELPLPEPVLPPLEPPELPALPPFELPELLLPPPLLAPELAPLDDAPLELPLPPFCVGVPVPEGVDVPDEQEQAAGAKTASTARQNEWDRIRADVVMTASAYRLRPLHEGGEGFEDRRLRTAFAAY
jgi:hypothetical protein